MIDLHCHILPGIDDGPKTLNESLEMARIFEQAGYSHVVATPHAVPGTTWMPKPEEIKKKIAELNHAIVDNGINLKVLPGMEIALDPNISDLLDQGRVQPLAGTSYVLIEPPFQRLPLGWDQAVFNVLSRGFAVLLAHPERCSQLAAKPQLCDQADRIRRLFPGQLGQLFRTSRPHDPENGYLSGCAKAYIHCLATDSHDSVNRNAAQVQRAAATIEELIGPRNLQLISRENPMRVLRNEALDLHGEVSKAQAIATKKSRWRFWRNGDSGSMLNAQS